MLSREDKKTLLVIGRETLDLYTREGNILKLVLSEYPEKLRQKNGVFVSLHKDGKLRGCIGRFSSDLPLVEMVRDMSISAASRDFRFKQLEYEELENTEIEISVLGPLEPISDISKIQLGKHGIYIKKGSSSGTFLPQVAVDTGWDLEEFLGHCSRDKAGLGWHGWKEAELSIYEATVFSEAQI